VNDVLFWVGTLLLAFVFVMYARMIMGFVLAFSQYRPSGAAAVAFELVYTVTDPPLKLLGRFIPPLRLGSVSLDLSFLVLILVLQIVANELRSA
jgi:YggT family protein